MIDAIGGVLLYLGLLAIVAGLLSAVYPLRFAGIRTRRRGLGVALAGVAAFALGVYLPAPEVRVANPRTHLDEFAAVYQFSEYHSVLVHAPREKVDRALWQVRPGEIRYFRTLMRMRGLRLPRADRPILDSFTSGWFRLLADEPGREVVFGRTAPGIRIMMNFRMEDAEAGYTRLTTETRVYAVGTHMYHGFAAYWRMIRPGSGLIRKKWLRAIQQRAEAAAAEPAGTS